jgi:hypothetical protein
MSYKFEAAHMQLTNTVTNPFDLQARDELLAILAGIQPASLQQTTPTVLCRLNDVLGDQWQFFPAIVQHWHRYLCDAYFEATGSRAEFMFASSSCADCSFAVTDDLKPGPQQLQISVFCQAGEKQLSTTIAINAATPMRFGLQQWELLTGLQLPHELLFEHWHFQVAPGTRYFAKAADHVFLHRSSTMSVVLRLKMD